MPREERRNSPASARRSHEHTPEWRSPRPVRQEGPSCRDLEIRLIRMETEVDQMHGNIADIKSDTRALRDSLGNLSKESNKEFKTVRKEMKHDFRILFGTLILIALTLTGQMLAGFKWL